MLEDTTPKITEELLERLTSELNDDNTSSQEDNNDIGESILNGRFFQTIHGESIPIENITHSDIYNTLLEVLNRQEESVEEFIYTQSQVAEKANTSRPTISRIQKTYEDIFKNHNLTYHTGAKNMYGPRAVDFCRCIRILKIYFKEKDEDIKYFLKSKKNIKRAVMSDQQLSQIEKAVQNVMQPMLDEIIKKQQIATVQLITETISKTISANNETLLAIIQKNTKQISSSSTSTESPEIKSDEADSTEDSVQKPNSNLKEESFPTDALSEKLLLTFAEQVQKLNEMTEKIETLTREKEELEAQLNATHKPEKKSGFFSRLFG